MSIIRSTTRRSFLCQTTAGAAGLLLPVQHTIAASACALDTELTEGPYYLNRGIERRNVTEGKDGLPLHLRVA
jgi:hypothetical protein